jgi:hypothetical protein
VKSPALLGAALLAAVLTAVLTAPTASATTRADPAPTNVHVTWKDETFTHVRVTWEEDEPRPNKIVLRHKGTTAAYLPVYVGADAPNVVDIDASSVRSYAWYQSTAPLELAVAVGAASTGVTSPLAVTEAFDAFTPDPSDLRSTTISGTNSVTVKWGPATETDETPNDPLDRKLPYTYVPYYSLTKDGTKVPLGKQGPATQLTFTAPKPLIYFSVIAHNEWGGQFDGAWVTVRPTQLTVKVPAWAVYNGTTKITGTFTPADEQRQVVLQARNSSASPWYVVGSETNSGGKFEFYLGTAGTRQYRVAIPNSVYYNGGAAYFGTSSAAAKSTTQLQTTGYFWWTQIYAGWTNEARLRVAPGVNTTATLQRWNGKTWITVGPVKVKNGIGTCYIRATKASRTAYRYYVPATMHGGLYYAASYTSTFVNVVVP